MAKFGTFLYGDETLFGDGDSDPVFPIDNLVRVPWVFKDIASGDEYEFAVNPIDASFPAIERQITTEYSTAGNAIMWEGSLTPQRITFSGTILYQAHFEAMEEWFSKSTQINLTDDLGRSMWIYIENFNPTRDYRPEFPWKFEYSASAVLLSW